VLKRHMKLLKIELEEIYIRKNLVERANSFFLFLLNNAIKTGKLPLMSIIYNLLMKKLSKEDKKNNKSIIVSSNDKLMSTTLIRS
jgi:hypothetical protein